MIVSLVYRVTRKPPSVPAVLLRRRAAKEAESLVLRQWTAFRSHYGIDAVVPARRRRRP
ncbi:hypothetical protein [Streptomyces hirsutus]|uniref:hypothetical protein n=1 Tax=Streptomyces hirsutus TaxID=35620 RepID=UPI000B081851|nr:hypothetical protein [Streptomyces hirsutus]